VGIQRKGGLRVGAANDPLEQDADRMAARVTESTRPDAQHVSVRRAPDGNVLSDSFDAGPEIEKKLQANRGQGAPLPAKLRRELEPRMGADFSGVRIHTGATSDKLNQSLAAQAFTHGSDIYMGAGKYDPASNSGRHLLTHELAHVMQQGGGVHRYPADALKTGEHMKWVTDTATVYHPGEGVSGGVYIFTGVNGPVDKLVVKPEFSEQSQEKERRAEAITTAGHTSFASTLLSKIGVRTPSSRFVRVGSTEESEIIESSKAKGAEIPRQVQPDEYTTRHLTFLSVMGEVKGSSVGKAASNVATRWDANTLIGRLNQPQLMHQVGQMIAMDSFMDNPDRVIPDAANLGNIMFADNVATAIDSNSSFREIKQRVDNNQFAMRSITALFGSRDKLIDSFFTGIELAIKDPEAREHFNNYKVVVPNEWAQWRQSIATGIVQGIAKIKEILASKSIRKELKGKAKAWEGWGAAKMSWEGFRMNEKYFNLMDQGEDPKEARRKLEEYRLYRMTRAKRMKGLKWTAKFFKQKVPKQA
jgi:hypothetical protein